ncbi:nsa2 [Symbiodinium sp. CCMP2456]|nr:nsa2 [Symbiodinium sp. CCMP2456]
MLVDVTQSDLEGNDIPAEAGPTQQATANFGAEVAWPRAALQAQDAPDAAKAFQALSTSMASPKFSFGSRAKGSQSRPKAPGPGSYMDPSADLNSRHKRLPRFGFGTDSRLVKLVNRTPGPGSYSVTMVLGSANKVSCTPRREVKQTKPRQKAPGPGAYNLPEFRSGGPKVSITPRRECRGQDTSEAEQTPGPGEYHQNSSSRTPRFSFGTARQRARLQAELGASTPGPGAYRNHDELPHDPSNLRASHR